MNRNIDEEEIILAERLEGVQKYLKRYEKQLFSLMNSLEEIEGLEQRTKVLEAVVIRFEKVALKFFEVGYKLDEFRAKKHNAGVLDTAAAKEEILRRLDRIVKSKQDEKADG
jgi:hypothetical protein